MIQYLFPTSYPSYKNTSDTFSTLILGNSNIWANLEFSDILTPSMRAAIMPEQSQYSYLKIDSKVYTITQITWINDIYNHVKYKKLIKNYRELMEWKDDEKIKINREIEKLKKKFQKDFSQGGEFFISKNDIESLNVLYDKRTTAEYQDYLNPASLNNPTFITTAAAVKDYFNNLGKLIEYFRTFIIIIKTDPIDFISMINIVNNIKTTKELIKPSVAGLRYESNAIFEKKLEQLYKDTKSIDKKIKINENYISRPGINQNFNNDEEVKNELMKNYSKYTSFSNSLNEFIKPKLDSTNNELQNTFIEFIENTDSLALFNAVMNPLYINDISKYLNNINNTNNTNNTNKPNDTINLDDYKKKLDTGITIIEGDEKGPKYEIILRVDVIAGEITEETKSKINCVYQGEALGDAFDKLLNAKYINFWELNPSRFFIDLTTKLDKIMQEDKESKEKEESKKDVKQESKGEGTAAKVIKGGEIQYNTRKLRSIIIQTRRKYY